MQLYFSDKYEIQLTYLLSKVYEITRVINEKYVVKIILWIET